MIVLCKFCFSSIFIAYADLPSANLGNSVNIEHFEGSVFGIDISAVSVSVKGTFSFFELNFANGWHFGFSRKLNAYKYLKNDLLVRKLF